MLSGLQVKGRHNMQVMIQYDGFTVSRLSRIYNFQVADSASHLRQFSVEVSLQFFHATGLKFQDAPLITRERLEQELEEETDESRAETRMRIADTDILQYLEKHYPPKVRRGLLPRSPSR